MTNFDFDDNDDAYSDDKLLYQEISNAIDNILGDKISMVQKLELYDYLLYKMNQMLKEYIDSYSRRQFYSSPYQNPYFGSYQMPNNIQLYYMQPCYFYPPGMPLLSSQIPVLPFYQQPPQQPPQFNLINQIPQPNKISKSDSESESKSESESESSEKHHHHHHKKDKKKSKKDKKSKNKKSKAKNIKGKKVKEGNKKAQKVESITPICTCAITKHEYIRQKWYHCRTCDLIGDDGCCEYCANICHKGHDVFFEYVSPSCFCDCFDTGNCKILPPSDLRCTFEITNGVAVDQPMYQCEDCGITGDQYICQNCALSKHDGHELSLADDVHGKICHHYTKK